VSAYHLRKLYLVTDETIVDVVSWSKLVKVPAARKIARDAPTTLAPVLAKQVPTKQKPYNPPSPVPGPADVPDSKSDESDPSSAVAVKIDSFAKLAVAFVGFAALFL
jgi:hypothetical protein